MVVNRALLCLAVMSLPALSFGTTVPPKTPLDRAVAREMDRVRSLQSDLLRKIEKSDESREELSSFGPEQRRFIRQWFSEQVRVGTLPRNSTAPGTDRFDPQLNQVLPQALLESSRPLPPALELELPPLPSNLKRLVVSGNILLLEADASTIMDVIHDVF